MLDNPSTSGTLDIAKQLSLLATSSEDSGEELRKWCQEAIQALPGESQGVRDGNLKVLNKILGRVMKLSDGRADAQKAKKTLTDLLSMTMP
jgi:aspartyl-tRNA(Asn)/glutamyl-tRNA(Gln) amidotransferase subunit B